MFNINNKSKGKKGGGNHNRDHINNGNKVNENEDDEKYFKRLT